MESNMCKNWKKGTKQVKRTVQRFAVALFCLLVTIVFANFVHSEDPKPQRPATKRAVNEKQAGTSLQSGLAKGVARYSSAPDSSIQDALKAIPWTDLGAAAKSKIKPVVTDYSLFHRMPTQTMKCNEDIFRYFLQHPDMIVAFWEQLGVTQISLKETAANRYALKESAGTIANAEIIYRDNETCVVYAKGQYRGPVFAKTIEGETVLVLRYRFAQNEQTEQYVVCNLDCFVKMENVGGDILAKLLSNVVGKIADSNFEQTVGFIGSVSDTIDRSPYSVVAVVRRMANMSVKVRLEFLEIVDLMTSESVESAAVQAAVPTPMSHPNDYRYGNQAALPRKGESPSSDVWHRPSTPDDEPELFVPRSLPIPVMSRSSLTSNHWAPPVASAFTIDGEQSKMTDEVTEASLPQEPSKSRAIFRSPTIHSLPQ